MKKHYETEGKRQSEDSVKSLKGNTSKKPKHVLFMTETQSPDAHKGVVTSASGSYVHKFQDLNQKEEERNAPYVNVESSLHEEDSDDNTMEISDVSGNVSFIKVHASPELKKSILNASVCVEKLDTSNYLDSSVKNIKKEERCS